MTTPLRNATVLVGAALLVSVVTQLLYMATLGGPAPSDPSQGVTHADRALYFTQNWNGIASIWMTELAAFTLIAVAGLVALVRGAPVAAAWAALAVSGLCNMVQVGIGLSMFQPSVTAGDALEPMFRTVLAGAFFFYFLAKVLIGLAGIGLGIAWLRHPTVSARVFGGITALVGLAAAVANTLALPQGLALTQMAGGTGTLAALFTSIAALFAARLPVVADAFGPRQTTAA